jgi:hypothetical protein
MRLGLLLMVICFSVIAGGPAHSGPSLGLPEVSLGSNPYRSFANEIAPGVIEDVLTVPEGQEFIITMFKGQHSYFELLQGSTVILRGRGLDQKSSYSIAVGRGRLMIEEGATLSVRVTSTVPGHYYLQGHFVQAGSPYRAANGTSSATSPATVFTADEDRDFLVRTIGLSTYSCDVYVDGSMVIPGQSYSTFDLGPHYGSSMSGGGFAMGQGALVLPAGSQLQIVARDGVTCDYYIDGEYIIF